MKKNTIIALFLLISALTMAQKGEKIKGSKTVTIKQKEIENFSALEISDNIEVFLDRGEKCELKIEADDNLHDIINIDVTANTLRINTTKEATKYKKLIVRITYNKELKMITAKNNVIINAIQEIQLDDISFKSLDNSKLYLNVNSKKFSLQSDNNSKTELNLKSENTTITLSEKSNLKALITTLDFKCDLYQKAKATLEGDVSNANLRLDNNSILDANKLVLKNADVLAENYAICSVNVNKLLRLEASGNAIINLYGDQKIEVKKLMDNASILKKPTK